MVTSPSPTTAATGASVAAVSSAPWCESFFSPASRGPPARAQIDRDQVVAVGASGDDVGGGAVGRDAHHPRARCRQRLADGLGAILVHAEEIDLAAVGDDGEAAQGEALLGAPAGLRHDDRDLADGDAGGHARDDAAAAGARDDAGGATADAHRRQAAEAAAFDDHELAGAGDAVGLARPRARLRQPDGAGVADAVDLRRTEGGRDLARIDDVGKAGRAAAGEQQEERDGYSHFQSR